MTELILMFQTRHYPDFEQKIRTTLEAFQPLYEEFRYDYKIVIGTSIDEISRKNEYVSYIRNIHRSMPECSVHRVDAADVDEAMRRNMSAAYLQGYKYSRPAPIIDLKDDLSKKVM